MLERTGISRRTFYAHFADREDCFFAAYDAIVADLAALLESQPEDHAGSELELPLRRTLSHYATWSAHARVLLIEILCAGPAGVARYEQTMAMLALRLSACRRWQPGTCDSLARADVAQASLGAMLRIVQHNLIGSGGGEALPPLLPSLIALTTRVELVRRGPGA